MAHLNNQELKTAQEIAAFAVGRGITDPSEAMKQWNKHNIEFAAYYEANKSEANNALYKAAA